MKFSKTSTLFTFVIALALSFSEPAPIQSLTTNLFEQRKCSEKSLAVKDSSSNVSSNSVHEVAFERTPHLKTQKTNADISLEETLTLEVKGPKITARFTPKNDMGEKVSLREFASALGYDHFNWVNYVEQDPYGIEDHQGKLVAVPYNDPPPGGYLYESADELPFYWDLGKCDRCQSRHHYDNWRTTQEHELMFEDIPADYRLQPGEAILFVTHLVGVRSLNMQIKEARWDVLLTFKWGLSNSTRGQGSVFIVEENVDFMSLSPKILKQMQADGAIVPMMIAKDECAPISLSSY